MTRVLVFAGAFLVSTFCPAVLSAQAPPATQTPAPQRPRKTTFWQWLIRVSGIAANPSTLKAPPEIQSGQVWLFVLGGQPPRPLTAGGGYRSPVFVPGTNDILILRGADIVRLSTTGGEPHTLYTIRGITKFVGFNLDDPDAVLTLTHGETDRPGVGFLSLKTGKLVSVPYDPASSEDRRMVEHLRGWDRMYGGTSVYVKSLIKETLAGPLEWTDVFLQAGTDSLMNVSQCDGVDCGEPSLSADGRRLVFVKAEQQ